MIFEGLFMVYFRSSEFHWVTGFASGRWTKIFRPSQELPVHLPEARRPHRIGLRLYFFFCIPR